MPGFEKVLQILVKITLKKANTNEVKILQFYLESTQPKRIIALYQPPRELTWEEAKITQQEKEEANKKK